MNTSEIVQQNNQPTLPKQMIMKRNAPYLYQLLYVTQLDWPSLTVDWISEYKSNRTFSSDIETPYNLVMGTHTDRNQPNYIIIAKVRVPNQSLIRKKYQNNKPIKSETVKKNDDVMEDRIHIQSYIPHEGQVNRVRHNPHQFTKIASRTPSGQIHIFSTTLSLKKQSKVCPQLRLVGHSQVEGYAIQWNYNKNWQIAAGSYDGHVSVWDCCRKEEKNQVTPLINFNFHKCQVEDISYNKFHDCILASCDDEGYTVFWDIRDCSRAPVHKLKAHTDLQYSVQFSPDSQYNFGTCGSDSYVKVWDFRNCNGPLFVGQDPSHDQITQIQWSRQNPTTIWSVSRNKAVLWQMSEEKIKFIHASHRDMVDGEYPNRINQLSVNLNQPDTIATVDSNNQIHIFQPNENCKL